ncbi:TetR/AcrR family transcriptional regulator, partial [Clavibacter michiganensis]|uniref:TetR/AcrR family transcriptional regulator n=1 Tax=Clavibacter michiganensis TaxID=28447 RepID=UPI00292DF2C5
MDQIAKAAGVVRRTVYGHFPSREALVSTLVDDAIESLCRALVEGSTGIAEPDAALVGAVFAVWPIVDRYRLLISMAEYHVSIDGLAERLAPVRTVCAALIRNGKEAGLFTS